MIAIGPVVLLGLIIGIVYGATHVTRSHHVPARDVPAPDTKTSVDALLARWTAAGLLSEDQATTLARYEADAALEAAQPQPTVAAPEAASLRVSTHIPVVAEALGYLGGMLAVIGLSLVVGRYWPDMQTATRLALSGAGAIGLVVAGFVVHPDGDPALERLRGFLWVASCACAALFAGVVAVGLFDADAAETIVLAASAAVVVESGLLWRGRRLPFQQLTLFAGLPVLVGSTVASIAGVGAAGIAVWATGAALVVIGLRRLAPIPLIGDTVGGVTMVIGAMLTTEWWHPAVLFVVATACVLLALALVPGLAPAPSDQRALGIIGAVAGLQVAPGAIAYFAQEAGVVTGVIVWIAGLALVCLGMRAPLRLPVVTELIGATAMLVGAAVTSTQLEGFAPIFGIVTAVGLLAAGTLPGQGLLTLVGCVGLLTNVPWAIGHFFPGEGRAPLLIMVAGALIIAIAVMLSRSGKIRSDLRNVRGQHRVPSQGSGPPRIPPHATPGRA